MLHLPRTTVPEYFGRYIPTIGDFGIQWTSTGVANRVGYFPIIIPRTLTIDRLGIVHGDVAAGNFYMAIYDSEGERPRRRLAVSHSTPCNGISRKQQVEISPSTLKLEAGYYFIALEPDNSSDNFGATMALWNTLIPSGDVTMGPTWYRQDMPSYIPPPLGATPTGESLKAFMAWVRVLSVP